MEDYRDMVRCSDGKWRHPGPGPMPPEHGFRLQEVSLEIAPPKKRRWYDIALDGLASVVGFLAEQWGAIIMVLFGMTALAFVLLLVLGAVEEAKSPVFTLHKNEWVCSMEHTQVNTTFMLSGKTMIPLTTSVTICDRYDRRL